MKGEPQFYYGDIAKESNRISRCFPVVDPLSVGVARGQNGIPLSFGVARVH